MFFSLSQLYALLAFFVGISSALPIAKQEVLDAQKIKFVVFKTADENAQMLARVEAFSRAFGGLELQVEDFPSQQTYASNDGKELHSSWFKVERTLQAMEEASGADWILAVELSSIPQDGSAAIDLNGLIAANPSVSVFLKRQGMGFAMAMYRNDPQIKQVLTDLWAKRSTTGSVGAAFATHTFWNPSFLAQIKFI